MGDGSALDEADVVVECGDAGFEPPRHGDAIVVDKGDDAGGGLFVAELARRHRPAVVLKEVVDGEARGGGTFVDDVYGAVVAPVVYDDDLEAIVGVGLFAEGVQ